MYFLITRPVQIQDNKMLVFCLLKFATQKIYKYVLIKYNVE